LVILWLASCKTTKNQSFTTVAPSWWTMGRFYYEVGARSPPLHASLDYYRCFTALACVVTVASSSSSDHVAI
jgi:hypothetical protein